MSQSARRGGRGSIWVTSWAGPAFRAIHWAHWPHQRCWSSRRAGIAIVTALVCCTRECPPNHKNMVCRSSTLNHTQPSTTMHTHTHERTLPAFGNVLPLAAQTLDGPQAVLSLWLFTAWPADPPFFIQKFPPKINNEKLFVILGTETSKCPSVVCGVTGPLHRYDSWKALIHKKKKKKNLTCWKCELFLNCFMLTYPRGDISGFFLQYKAQLLKKKKL